MGFLVEMAWMGQASKSIVFSSEQLVFRHTRAGEHPVKLAGDSEYVTGFPPARE
jgi:hypothetical protein